MLLQGLFSVDPPIFGDPELSSTRRTWSDPFPLQVFHTMPDLCVASKAELRDVLSVPAQFSIAPSGSLSVAALLLINLPTVLETDASATRIIFSKMSPLLQFPADFVSQPVPPFQTASSLQNRASGAFQNRDKLVIHPSFPNDPLPMWVVSYWVVMSHALENQRDWRTSHDWVYDRLNVISTDRNELEIIDEVLDVLESLPWDAPLKGFGAQTDLRTIELQSLCHPHAADVELDPSDVSVDTVLQHIALGESSVPHGYSAGKLGNLLVDNESESYEREEVLDDMTGLQSMADGYKEVEAEGRGKCRRVANTQFDGPKIGVTVTQNRFDSPGV
ncbi:hypothetical protein BDR07DRAFT_1608610 [Suillus spraguei]|nr:hypothetical protein BDR07DRAFT_1608610 [Suillus spraguei]